MDKRTLLFNPINVVHDRSVALFKKFLPGWNVRCLYNAALPWFAGKKGMCGDAFYIVNGRIPADCLEGVRCIVLFVAQPRIPLCNLIREAAVREIPVVAIQETHQMMLEQGYINNYFLPVDLLCAASDYERDVFMALGLPTETVLTTGCAMRYKELDSPTRANKEKLKGALGLDKDRRVATLTIRYITPHGETHEVRGQILECVSKGLPQGFQLFVKPHPGDQERDTREFVRSYAPGAVIADPHRPISDILDVTDVLFDRGNSQVVVDALQAGVPVCAVPMGKKTVFEGMADAVIVRESADIPRILALIEERGMSLYGPIMAKHLSVDAEAAIKGTLARIVETAEAGVLYKPGRRLAQLGLFWAWMGYPSQALATLESAASTVSGEAVPFEAIHALVRSTPSSSDIERLKRWQAPDHVGWIIQSLFIKALYMKDKGLNMSERQWLSGFPPTMNRSHFLPYADMLYRLYKKSGLAGEADALAQRLRDESLFTDSVKKRDWRMRFDYTVKLAAKNLVFSLNSSGLAS